MAYNPGSMPNQPPPPQQPPYGQRPITEQPSGYNPGPMSGQISPAYGQTPMPAQPSPYNLYGQPQNPGLRKSWSTTLLLCYFLGLIGAHRFYTGKTGTAILQIFTLGGLGIWTAVDLVMIITGSYTDKNGQGLASTSHPNIMQNPRGKLLAITLLLCSPIGLHRFYVGKTGTAILQLILSFTAIGIIWWIVDIVMIVVGSFKDKDGQPLVIHWQ